MSISGNHLGSPTNPPEELFIGDGSSSLPAITFGNDTNTGFYRITADTLGIATNGSARWRIENDVIRTITGGGRLNVGDGSVATPSISFENDNNSGFYRGGSDFISVSLGGADAFSFAGASAGAAFLPGIDNVHALGSTALGWTKLYMMDGTEPLPAITFRNDNDTGLYRIAANRVGFSANGTLAFDYTNTRLEVYNVPLWLGDGTAAAPSLTFSLGNTTGMYRSGTHQISFSLAGAQRLELNGSAMTWKNSGSHAYFYIDRANNTSEGLTIFSTGGVGSAAVGLDNDGTEKLCFFTNNDLGTPKVTIDTGGTTTFVEGIRQKNGSAAAPSYTFTNSITTGMCSPTVNRLDFASDGVTTLRLRPTYNESMLKFHVPDGTSALPSFTFDSAATTGLYKSSTNQMGFTSNASAVWITDSSIGFRPAADNTFDNGSSGARWANVWGTTIHAGDLMMENDWRITEGFKVGHPEEGIMFKSPEGKLYKIAMTEVE